MNITTEIPDLPTPDVTLMEHTPYKIYDCLLAAGFLVCLTIGLPGNFLSLCYFHQKKQNLSSILYKVACVIDIISSVDHLPLTINLLNNREPGLLGYGVVCSVWYFILLWVQQTSAFVVMLISLTRALVIVFPFYKIRKDLVVGSILVYFIYHFIWNLIYIFIYGNYYYSHGFGYCGFSSKSLFFAYYRINYSICMGFSPLFVFVGLVACILQLYRRTITRTSQKNNRQSSITIVYFTAIFLLCNLCVFLNNTVYMFTKILDLGYPGQIYRSTFMFFYSWILSEIFCTVLNASLNPLLYIYRMKRMRMWVMRIFGVHKEENVEKEVYSNQTCESQL